MTKTDLAWQAGMFEGEGSVRINCRTSRNLGVLLVDVPNIQPEVTAAFHDAWGGYHRLAEVAPPRRNYWRWRLAATQAVPFLIAIRPYLRTECYRERVALGLEYQAQKAIGGANRVPGYAERQHDYYLRMRELNRRGC